MRSLFLAASALVFASFCLAQEKPVSPQPNKAEPPKATVSGRVVRAEDGEPLKKVFVVLRKNQVKGEPLGAGTDADGRFVIREVDSGKYYLSVSRNGYVRQTYGETLGNPRGTVLSIAEGQTVKDMNFRMVPGGVITGRVVDEDGEPVAEMQIMVMRYTYNEGERQLAPVNYAMTDDHGEYRAAGLQARDYFVSARFGSFNNGTIEVSGPLIGESPKDSYVPTYFPGTTEVSRASMVRVKAGQDTRADFVIIPTKTVKIKGRVVDGNTGLATKRAFLSLLPKNTPMRWGAEHIAFMSNNNDEFEFRGIAAGSYTLFANIWGEKPQTARQDLEVADSNIDNVVITTRPGRELEGHVRMEGKGDPNGIFVGLVSETVKDAPGGESFDAVKADGSFTLKAVGEDDYTLRVRTFCDDCYVKSARVGTQNLLENGFDGSKQPDGACEIVVSANAGKVQGAVSGSDGKPFAGAVVVLVPERPGKSRSERTKTTTTDQNGRFLVRGIRPGNYKLYAWEAIEPGAEQDPDFLKQFDDKAQKISVSEGEQESAELKVIASDQKSD